MWETWVWSLGWEDPPEEGMAIRSSILAWRIPTDRGAWWAAVHGVAESRPWQRLSTAQHSSFWVMKGRRRIRGVERSLVLRPDKGRLTRKMYSQSRIYCRWSWCRASLFTTTIKRICWVNLLHKQKINAWPGCLSPSLICMFRYIFIISFFACSSNKNWCKIQPPASLGIWCKCRFGGCLCCNVYSVAQSC